MELADGLPLYKVGEIIVANGQEIPNFGRAKCETVDEFGNECKMEDMSTEVHKPFDTEIHNNKYCDAFIVEEFGASFPGTAELQKAYEVVSSIVSASWMSWNSTSVT